jgi:hypothetical protein
MSSNINRAGNEMADKLAREGSVAILCGSEPALPLSGCTAQMITKMWADNAHLSYWKSLTNCRQSKLWLVGPKLNVKKYLLRLSRDTLRNLILITGHGKFRKHLHRMGLSDNTLLSMRTRGGDGFLFYMRMQDSFEIRICKTLAK